METHRLSIILTAAFFLAAGCANPPVVDGGDLGYKKTSKTGKYFPEGDRVGAPVEEIRTEVVEVEIENPNNSEGAEMTIGADGSLSSENAGSMMSEGDRAAIFWGGLIFAAIGVVGVIGRFTYQIKFPFAVGIMMVGIGGGAVFLDGIAGAGGILGVLAYLGAVTAVAWWASSTSMGRDASRDLKSEVERLKERLR